MAADLPIIKIVSIYYAKNLAKNKFFSGFLDLQHADLFIPNSFLQISEYFKFGIWIIKL